MIAADDGAEAKRLSGDVLWQAKRWAETAAKHEELVGTRYEDSAPLTDAERADVMRAAVAYSLAGDMASLVRLRTRYATKMATGPDARGFDVVTQGQDTTGVDYRNLIKRLAGVDTLEAFMTDFRARYGAGGATTPSAVN